MTRTVNCLVDDGYVVRRPHATDGRQVLVDLTERATRSCSPTAAAATPGWPGGCASSPPTNAPSSVRPPP